MSDSTPNSATPPARMSSGSFCSRYQTRRSARRHTPSLRRGRGGRARRRAKLSRCSGYCCLLEGASPELPCERDSPSALIPPTGIMVIGESKSHAHPDGVAIYVGTSGWMYESWARLLYPGLPRKKWLAHAASVFTGLEVNATFYRQQKEDTFRAWRDETPPDFRFAIKAHRYITHYKRLRDVRASVTLLRRPAL